MGLTGGGGGGLSGTGAFPGNPHLSCPDRDAHADHISGRKAAAELLGPHTVARYRLAVPAIEAKDAVGLGDDMPALEIMQRDAIGLSLSNMPARQAAP